MRVRRQKRVVVVGGAGETCRWVVRTAAQSELIYDLVVTDADLGRARAICNEAGGPTRAVLLDITDELSLRALLEVSDVVLNISAPFAIHGHSILSVAIEYGCDYLDIDDDSESTLSDFEFDSAAKSSGVRAIKGMGASPGVNNLLAGLATAELDQVDTLLTGWKIADAKSDPEIGVAEQSAALVDWLCKSNRNIYTWENSRCENAEPLTYMEIDLPEFGRHPVYTGGRAGPVTLARSIPVRGAILSVMSGPEWVFDALGAISHGSAIEGTDFGQAKGRLTTASRTAEIEVCHDPLPPFWALANGMRDGKNEQVLSVFTQRLSGSMGGAAGIALAVALHLLLEGCVESFGVMAPEMALNPVTFFRRVEAVMNDCSVNDQSSLRIIHSQLVS